METKWQYLNKFESDRRSLVTSISNFTIDLNNFKRTSKEINEIKNTWAIMERKRSFILTKWKINYDYIPKPDFKQKLKERQMKIDDLLLASAGQEMEGK